MGPVRIGVVERLPQSKGSGSQAPLRTLTLLAPLTTCKVPALIPDNIKSAVWHSFSPAALRRPTSSYLSSIALTSSNFAIMDPPAGVQA
jgi:hypothetical protein